MILIYLLYLITNYLVRRHHVASWLQHWGHRHLAQHRPSTSEVLFGVTAYGIDRIRHYTCMDRTTTFLICCKFRNTIQVKSKISFIKGFTLTHLSAFLCSDVFLKGDHVWDGLDGHQVDTWRGGDRGHNKKFCLVFIFPNCFFPCGVRGGCWSLSKLHSGERQGTPLDGSGSSQSTIWAFGGSVPRLRVSRQYTERCPVTSLGTSTPF